MTVAKQKRSLSSEGGKAILTMDLTATKTKSIYGVHPGVITTQKWIRELKMKTGRSLDEWLKFIKKEGPPTELARREWLKSDHNWAPTPPGGWLSVR